MLFFSKKHFAKSHVAKVAVWFYRELKTFRTCKK